MFLKKLIETFKKLHGDDAEDKLKQKVHDEYVEDVLERVDDAVENGLNNFF